MAANWETALRIVVGIVLILILGCAFLLLLHAVPGDATTAAWVQAVGTVLAVFVAMYIPWRLHYDSRSESHANRALRGRSLAIAILPEILELKEKASRTQTVLVRTLGQWAGEPEDAGGDPGPRLGQLAQGLHVAVPDAMRDSVLSFYLLGSAAAPEVQQSLAYINQFNRMVDQTLQSLARQWWPTPQQAIEHLRYLMAELEMGIDSLRSAEEAVGPIHDGEITPSWD